MKLLLSKKSHSAALPLRYAFEALAREMHLVFEGTPDSFLKDTKKVEQLQTFLSRQSAGDQKGYGPLFFHVPSDSLTSTVLRWKGSVPLRRETVHFMNNLLEGKVRIEFR